MRAIRLRNVVGAFSLCLLIAWAALPAWGEDLYAPPWRGREGTTFARWEYDDSSLNPIPNEQVNPFGTSWTQINPELGEDWYESWGGRNGVWPLSGSIEVQIDNQWDSPPENYKDIWVQLSWAPQTAGAEPTVFETLFVANGSPINQIIQEPTGEAPPADTNWFHTTYLIHLDSNPAWEIVRIEGDIMVDELVIDTICIPEPMTLSLLAVGALGLLAPRRRRSYCAPTS